MLMLGFRGGGPLDGLEREMRRDLQEWLEPEAFSFIDTVVPMDASAHAFPTCIVHIYRRSSPYTMIYRGWRNE